MTSSDGSELIPLRLALYAPDAPLRGMRRREVREKVGPIIKRRSRYSRFRKEYLYQSDVTEYLLSTMTP